MEPEAVSGTPRTNEFLGLIAEAGPEHYGTLAVDDPWPDYRKLVDFARTLERENAALRERIAELEAGNAVLRAERDGYSARLDAAIKLIADILSALPPNAVKAPDGTIYEFDPPPEYAMQMLRAFKAGIDAAIREGR